MTVGSYRSRLVLGLVAAMVMFSGTSGAAAETVSFKEDVFPIIQIRCLECHQPGGKGYDKSGLDLRTYKGLMKGTKHGPIVVPRNPFMSNLIAVIDGRTDPEIRMPHKKKRMSKCERQLFRFWVGQGARNN